MRKHLATLAFALALGVHGQAFALINGDFEDSYFSDGTTPVGLVNHIPLANLNTPGWDVYTKIPGWTTNTGRGVEVQSNTVTQAHSGNRYIELDSAAPHSNSAVYQDVATNVGTNYSVDFYYYARPYANATSAASVINGHSTNGIEVALNGTKFLITDDHPGGGWIHIYKEYVATTSSTRLNFGALGLADTYGGFVDSVSFKAVPELDPKSGGAACLLLAFAVSALTGRRRNAIA